MTDAASSTKVPTRYLDPHSQRRSSRHTGLTGSFPQLARLIHRCEDRLFSLTEAPSTTTSVAPPIDPITLRRRRLLAIFGRLMARFYDDHERHWSTGQRECPICRERIIGWAWSSCTSTPLYLHDTCVSRSIWQFVLNYERLVQLGQAPDLQSVRFSL